MRNRDLKDILIKNLIVHKNKRVILLDFPEHDNLGDLLIWKGEYAFFKEQKKDIIQFNCYEDIKILKKIIKEDDVIYFHGGGNWGDLWIEHHNFRMKIMRYFTNNQYIIFPQTIFFRSEEVQQQCNDIVNSVKNVTIYVRDKISLNFAKENYNHEIILCPDMAFFLEFKITKKRSNNRKLLLLRQDFELDQSYEYTEDLFDEVRDWTDLISTSNKFHYLIILLIRKMNNKVFRFLLKINIPVFLAKKIDLYLYLTYVNSYINKARKEFCKFDTVETTRMHGHIFATLLRIKNTLVSNSYYKSKAFYDIWTYDDEISSFKNTI